MRGSTYKRCPCPTRKDESGRTCACSKRHGTWWYRVDAGVDPQTGKRIQVARGGFGTQREAQAELNRVLATVHSGTFRHDQRITVAEFLTKWLIDKEVVLRPTTLKDYQRHVENHINPRIGPVRLRDLRPARVTQLLRDLETSGLGVTSIRRVHAVLRSALSDAVRADLVTTNAAKHAHVVRRSRPKVHPWEPAEFGQFMDHAAGDVHSPIFELMAGAGLRRGEVLGLRWGDVDLQAGVIVVRQQVVQLDGAEHPCPTCLEPHKG